MVGASAMYHNFKMCKKDGLLFATHSRDRLIKVIKFDTNKMNVSIMILFSYSQIVQSNLALDIICLVHWKKILFWYFYNWNRQTQQKWSQKCPIPTYLRNIIHRLKESKKTIYLHSVKHTRAYKYCDACSQSETNIVDARWYSAHTQLTFLFLQDLISNSRYASVTPLNEIWIQICAFLLSSPGRSFHSLEKKMQQYSHQYSV